jgi:hypothetical protein
MRNDNGLHPQRQKDRMQAQRLRSVFFVMEKALP